MGITAAILMGFIGSLHCIGMCGPIAMMLPYRDESQVQKLAKVFLYNGGRITSYAILGLLPGLLGLGLQLGGYQKSLSIFIGVGILISTLFAINLESRLWQFPLFRSWQNWVQQNIGRHLGKSGRFTFYGIGFLNGLLPCGMVYIALAGALTQTSILASVLFMAGFGLGTVPMMLGLSWGSQWISLRWRKRIRRFMPVFMLLIAGLFILRGWQAELPVDLQFWLSPYSEIRCH